MKLAIVFLAAAVAMPAMAFPGRALSDRDLRRLDARSFDKRAMMNRSVVLGRHRGVRVLADYPCSDVCPDYTVRIIHYDARPGADCDRIGGATVPRRVPIGIATTVQMFCVPKAIAQK